LSRVPIRLRLALVFAAAMAIVLAGAGWFAYSRVSSDLSGALDQDLRGRGQDLSALVSHGGSVSTTRGSLIENGESFAEVVAADGSVLDATQPIARNLLTQSELVAARSGPVFTNRPSVPGLDEPARLLALPVTRSGQLVVLVVGATRENRAETLGSLRAAFLIGGPIALVLAALGGYLLAGAALRPIESMRRRAAEISTTSLDERLPVPDANDEVARLGETLNAMLARLEDGLERERRFLADASHELRTPLALLKTELGLALRAGRTEAELLEAIASAAEQSDRLARIADDLLLLARAERGGLLLKTELGLASKPGRTEDELRGAIASAAEQTDRLARIADDLLLLARAEQGELRLKTEEVDITDVMEEVARRFRSERVIAVEQGTPVVLTADRLRLEQALTNLVDNALRYGDGAVSLSATAVNGTAELHVQDQGQGFEPDFLPQAFERFTRPDEAREGEGSGLGLAIVDTIARAHHGTARAENLPGGGADVWIAVPLS
jgi:signal transduction histidine kinase